MNSPTDVSLILITYRSFEGHSIDIKALLSMFILLELRGTSSSSIHFDTKAALIHYISTFESMFCLKSVCIRRVNDSCIVQAD